MPGPLRSPSRAALVGGVLAIATAVLFARSLGCGLPSVDTWGGDGVSPLVQGGLTWAGLRWAFTGAAAPWGPLAWISQMADWQVFGGGAAGHHLTSLLLHGVNAVLLFAVARRLTRNLWVAAVCAALFAWHPLRTESVAWVGGRGEVLGGTWFLLTVWCHLGYARCRTTGEAGAGRWYLLTLAAYACGLMSDATLVSVPVVLLLLDHWPLRRAAAAGVGQGGREPWGRLVLEKIPMAAMGVAALVVASWGRAVGGGESGVFSVVERGQGFFVSVARHLAAFVWPFGLSVSYPLAAAWLVAGATVVVAASFVVAVQRRARPWLWVGWLWYLAMLVPAVGLSGGRVADGHTYVSLMGLTIAAVVTVRGLVNTRQARVAAAVAGGVVLAGCAARTWSQEGVWRSTLSLFEHAAAVEPNDASVQGRLGLALLAEGRVSEAAEHCERAVTLAPASPMAQVALARVRDGQGRIPEAIAAYERALALEPGLVSAEEALGSLYLREGDFAEAGALFEAVLKARPRSVESQLGLAEAQSALGKVREAEDAFRRAVNLAPRDVAVRLGYGGFLASAGRLAEAKAEYRVALEESPDDPEVLARLGDVLRVMRRFPEAEAAYRKSLARRPDDSLTQYGLGLDLEQMGRPKEALACYIRATRLKSDFSEAHLRVAVLMLDREKLEEALVHISRALETSKTPDVVHRTWADALSRHGYYHDAIAHYEEALRLKPDDAESHALVGALLWLTGKRSEAAAHWEAALKLDPHMPGLAERLKEAKAALAAPASDTPPTGTQAR